MKRLLLLALLVLAPQQATPDLDITVYLIGDSTMADKAEPETNPEWGWGQALPAFFDARVRVSNHAVNGRSSRSFIDEGRWDAVLAALEAGDYVFIQFGHNDQKDQDPARYTNAQTAYRKNLERFVRETREKGAYPVLFSPVVRRAFNMNGVLIDTHGAYPSVVREVATAMAVPFVDLQWLTEAMVIERGVEGSKALYLWLPRGASPHHPNGVQDNTHFSKEGAHAVARLVVQELHALRLLLGNFVKQP